MPTDEKGTQVQSSQAIVDTDLWYTIHDMATTPVTKTKAGTLIKTWLKTYFDTLYDVAAAIHAATSKATPVDADELGIVDSAASNVLKKLTWVNLKATLKTYFDTLYSSILPISDATAVVKGSSDATKLLRFEVDGFTAGQTRVMTPPNYDGTIATLAGTETFTNKRRVPRIVTVTQAAQPTINTDNGDVFIITGLAQAITSLTANLSGTPNNKEMILMEITDDGTGRTITPGAKFLGTLNNSLTGLTTVANKKLMLVWMWSATLTAWELVGKDQSL